MQSLFLIAKRDHDKANKENQGRQDLPKMASGRFAEADPVSVQIRYSEAQQSLSDSRLPGRAFTQSKVEPRRQN